MPAPSIVNIVAGHVRIGLTGLTVVERNCQTVSAALNANPNLQTVPATFCSPEAQSPAATGWALEFNLLQDWEDPTGLCWFLFSNDTLSAYWELALSNDEDAIMNGLCSLVAPSFGGAAGTVLQSTVSLPVPAKPTKGPIVTGTKATSAVAGIPGSYVGGDRPATVTLLTTAPAVVASPTTAWTTGQYVQTATTGAPGKGYWNGTAWTVGVAP